MATRARPGEREDALSRARIVEAAIEMLDGGNELTFRALAAQLRTGPGAIYWHVANKGELLAAAADAVIGEPQPVTDDPALTIRTTALEVFDAIEAHPWAGEQLARLSSQPTVLRIFERIGRQVQALGVAEAGQFTAASALLNYVLGVAGQHAAQARSVEPGTRRSDVLRAASTNLDPDRFPFIRDVAGQLREHDDRVQFLAGIDLILEGIRSRLPDGR
ncbi:TetR/AcrR family transcriptional regulator [Dactylosporangium vinaceum]|uniref:TetR/AcrR family transcriptional regulator n=1 Tax=Dactylosporangium vinaceum TaxID=53362 RepID=A0ABV5M967_9ACTN|nr:TetR/AcrR family transcriptional regulator C-terminal domain-containing protein [Dactylosporangium vinaceum]UAB99463.1 TetR/AcrR family transcriptional regulator [Dactylosporangium vinaceum]